jgi:hypothetical protein
MQPTKLLLENHIGFRVSQEVFEQIQMRADRAGKPANAWCREKVIEAAARPRVTVAEFAILAEVVAAEEILIELLWAIVKEGEPPIEKFRQITAKAHAAKQREAWKLLGETQTQAEANMPVEPARYSAPTAR